MTTYNIAINNNKPSPTGNIAIYQKTPGAGNAESIAWKVQPPSPDTGKSFDWNIDYNIGGSFSVAQPTPVAGQSPQQNVAGTVIYDANGNVQSLETESGSSFTLTL